VKPCRAKTFIDALDTRQASLAASASKLVESQKALDEAFDGRSTALAHLLSAMDAKHAEFDRSMTGFAETMTRALQEIEARTGKLGGSISETAASTVSMIEDRYAALRETAESEHALTTRTLTSALTDAYDQMNRLFDEAQTKFRTAASEIRGLSQSIQNEIEETRQELRRGAAELPRETAEQTQALRRVVGDQVKALGELTNIVARAGSAFDVAEPTPGAKRSTDSRTYRPEPAESEAPSVERTRPPAAARPQPTPPAQPTVAPPPPRAAVASPPQGGWLSDLLDRATRDDADETPKNSFDGLSLEIARMVDSAAVSDLWRRYQLGEKGAALFSRRLYTAQGRQTFDEISRRYPGEPAFRETIDQYIRNFEALVVESTRDDRDGSRAIELLTCDSGKVYTMLAHATGRFS
jgi:ABC-type transporter Mla subunit MlaD